MNTSLREPYLIVFFFCLIASALNAQDFTYVTNAGGTNITITGYTGPGGSVTIPSAINGFPVSSIGDRAFYGNTNLTSITIPNTVTSIGDWAFWSCINLTNNNFAFHEGLARIGDGAFQKSAISGSVLVPSTVTYVGFGSFQQTSGLSSIIFKGNAPYLGPWPFDSHVTLYYYQGATGWNSYPPASGYPPLVEIVPVNAPPTVITQPQSQLVSANSPVSFTVSVNGTIPLSYKWSRDGVDVLNPPPSTASVSALNLTGVEPSNLGAYVCIITNDFGAVTSQVANLYMYPYLASPFQGAVSYWGKDTTLSVGAWGTDVSYQWYKDGSAVSGATNADLTMPAIQFDAAGLYYVVVSNAYGSATNTAYQVIVNSADVALGLFPGVIISGTVGYSYDIQSTTNLASTNSWQTQTNITLTQPVQIWNDNSTDAKQPGNPQKYYRVLPGL